MYIIIRKNEVTQKEQVCLVVAKGIAEAKKMVGVSADDSSWIAVNDDLVRGLSDMKEGYVAQDL